MKLIYIAGPFRAANAWEIEQNIRRAEGVALEVWRAGFAALCPHTNTRFFQGAAPDESWLQGDIEMLRRCDGVMLCENWWLSSGTKAEVGVAVERLIPVYDEVRDIDLDRSINPKWLMDILNRQASPSGFPFLRHKHE
jgi:nucleoside 2-deoxyribosyltransferase